MRIDLMVQPGMSGSDIIPVIHALNYVRNIVNPALQNKIDLRNLGYYQDVEFQDGTTLMPHKSMNWFMEIAYNERLSEDTLNGDTFLREGITYCLKNKISSVVFVIDHDLKTKGEGWVLGATTKFWTTVVSINRFKNSVGQERLDLFKTLSVHEFGHLFGLVEKDRPRSTNFLGQHCINKDCVMQQGNWNQLKDAANRTRRYFCNLCQVELYNNAKKFKNRE